MHKTIFLVAAVIILLIVCVVVLIKTLPAQNETINSDTMSVVIDSGSIESRRDVDTLNTYTVLDFVFAVPEGQTIEREERLGDSDKCQSIDASESCKNIILTINDNDTFAAIKGVDFTLPMGCNFSCYSTNPSFSELKDETGIVRRDAKKCSSIPGSTTATEIKNLFNSGNEDECYSFTNEQGLNLIVTYESLYDQPWELVYHFENPNENFGYLVIRDTLTSSRNSENIFSVVQSMNIK